MQCIIRIERFLLVSWCFKPSRRERYFSKRLHNYSADNLSDHNQVGVKQARPTPVEIKVVQASVARGNESAL